MSGEEDKREHSLKPEVEDLTDYQELNSLGGAGVAGSAKETAARSDSDKQAEDANDTAPEPAIKYDGDYNDGVDFNPVDDKGETNA
jgi:hypothetical protein